MSKLGNLTNKKETDAISNAVNKLIGDGDYTKVEYSKIPVNEICFRYKNYYIDDIKKFNYIRTEIQNIGLQQPIIVVKIEEFLKQESIPEEEKLYLQKQQEQGRKYFISSGHRRYKAFVSLYLGKVKALTNDDIEEMYQNFGAPKYDIKYSEIICDIAENNEKEQEIYNATNLSNRGPSNFEYVVSYIESEKPDLEEKGYLKNTHDGIEKKYGNSISISLISDYIRIYNLFPKEWMECILNGMLPLSVAQKILPIYDEVFADPQALEKVKNGKFKIREYRKKTKENKNIKYSKKDVLEYLYSIKRNPEKLNEIIKMVEQM